MLLRDPVEAEDAAQQSFLSAYRSLLTGNRPEYPAAWLATIARNECWTRTQQRMRQPVPERVTEEIASPLPGPVEAAARNADLTALVAAIGALPAKQRDALLMREFSGMSYAQLSTRLSVSEPAVESLLVRARRELRVLLQPVYAASMTPVIVVRDLIGRLGAGSEPALATVAKVGAVPLAAKLAAGVATLAVVGGVVVGGDGPVRGSADLPAEAISVIGASDAAAEPARATASRPTAAPRPAMARSRSGAVSRPSRPVGDPSVRSGGGRAAGGGWSGSTAGGQKESQSGGGASGPASGGEAALGAPAQPSPDGTGDDGGSGSSADTPSGDDVGSDDGSGDVEEPDDGDDSPVDDGEAGNEGPGGGDDLADPAEAEEESSDDGGPSDDTLDGDEKGPSDDSPDEPEEPDVD